MNLYLKEKLIEFIYDELDTNAINFLTDDGGYFSIQTGVYLEADEQLNEPFIELNDQGNSQCGGIKSITFHNNRIVIQFTEQTPFLNKFSGIEILVTDGVRREIVCFLNSYLFLWEYTKYSDDFDTTNVVQATETRDYL